MLAQVINPWLDPVACAQASRSVFQPIISATSLQTHGFEALTWLPPNSGFANVQELLDAAYAQGKLLQVERALLSQAISRFAEYPDAASARLFCNVDNRIFSEAAVSPDRIIALVRDLGLKPANLVIETSERLPPESHEAFSRLLDVFLNHNIRIAIDDFGRGFSGLETLMLVHPHYIKIDRLFVDGIARSARQQAIVGKVIGLGHSLGLMTIAEGIETEADFRMVQELGCDLVQGYIAARPADVSELVGDYSANCPPMPSEHGIPPALAQSLIEVPPLLLDAPIAEAARRFKAGGEHGFIPLVDRSGFVHGALFEEAIHPYIYTDFGPALLANKGLADTVERLLSRCPISEVSAPAPAIIDSFLVAASMKGMILTREGRYVGVLTNQGILRLSTERELEDARDRNPLTFLPGNNSIGQHLKAVLSTAQPCCLIYFDFDHFKAFNDRYGFAVGDAVLLQFAELLLRTRHSHEAFIGHVGGDDFFASLPANLDVATTVVRRLLAEFGEIAASYYPPDQQRNGGFTALDRFGEERFLPLLRASATILLLPASRSHLDEQAVVGALSAGKLTAKQSAEGLAVVSLPPTPVARNFEGLRSIGLHPEELPR